MHSQTVIIDVRKAAVLCKPDGKSKVRVLRKIRVEKFGAKNSHVNIFVGMADHEN